MACANSKMPVTGKIMRGEAIKTPGKGLFATKPAPLKNNYIQEKTALSRSVLGTSAVWGKQDGLQRSVEKFALEKPGYF